MGISNEQTVRKVLEEISTTAIYEQQKSFLKEVQIIAQNFLDSYNRAYLRWENLKSHINSTETLRDKITNTYLYMQEDKEITQQMLQIVHSFQKELNLLFNRIVYLTYVDKTSGQLLFYNEGQIGKIYEQATKNYGRGNVSRNNILKIEQAQLEDRLKKTLKRSIENKKEVYEEALKRYNDNNKEEHMNYDPSKNTFWWRKDRWPWINYTKPFANRGWIAEGYAMAVLEDVSNFNNTNLEWSLSSLWYDYMNINSKPAAIQQDLVFGNIEFAIKSGSFSTPMIGQFIKLATGITFLKEDFSNINYFKKITTKIINLKTLSKDTVRKAELKLIEEIQNNNELTI